MPSLKISKAKKKKGSASAGSFFYQGSMRLTRIVCTLGPATSSVEMIEKLIQAGMDVARVNMSHGEYEDHARVIRDVRAAAKKMGRVVGILQDLQGPKIRVGKMSDGGIRLKRGEEIVVTSKACLGTAAKISINYKNLARDASKDSLILLDDGNLDLRVIKKRGGDVVCRVHTGGILKNNKGVNLPGTTASIKAFTSKDRADLDFGLKQKVDMVALSFVRQASDVHSVKRVIRKAGLAIPVIAKIEKPEAVEALDEIIAAADGLMVARGDLGVEMKTEEVPIVQKTLIAKANYAHKPVITATQMLDSMTYNPRPTRAETTDVSNAILDGTDAVMLSQETAVGKYPIETVQTMSRICRETEDKGEPFYRKWLERNKRVSVADVLTFAAKCTSTELGIKMIACFSSSGDTARHLSKYRPTVPIAAFSYQRHSLGKMALYRGTLPLYLPMLNKADDMFSAVCEKLLKKKLVSKGDTIIIVSGLPVGSQGSTNLMKIHTI